MIMILVLAVIIGIAMDHYSADDIDIDIVNNREENM